MRIMRRKEIISLVIIFIFGLAGSISVSAQEGKYTLVPLGDLKGPNTYPYDINDSGQVVGKGETDIPQEGGNVSQAFIWKKECVGQPGCLQPLFPDEKLRSSANAINKAGAIVGYRNGNAFLVESGGGFADLGIYSQNAYSEALGINSANNVTGYEGNLERAEFWERRTDGSYLKNDLGNLGFTFTQAVSINDANQIVGFTGLTSDTGSFVRAFRWQKVGEIGMMTELGAVQDSWDSYATRINNKGEIVGYSSGTDEFGNFISRACLWGSNGLIELKSMIPAADSRFIDYGVAYGVNDSTVVVGMQFVRREVDTQFVDEPRAFIWDAQNGMRDLNALALIPEGSGWVLAAATAINNKGEIVGYGYANGSSNYSAFLLIPPPSESNEDPAGPLKVGIDIRPWNSHNRINQHSWWGLVPVAILSAPGFNAIQDVDRKSLTFGPTGEQTHAAFCMPRAWDVNRDRQKDLICYFHERPADFQCGDVKGLLKGQTKSGREFEGEDTVQVLPCPPPKKHHKGR